MPVTLPDPTVFDADSDKISTSRPELKKMADAIVTIGGEYNAGTLAGGISEIVGGDGITVTQPDSAGSVTISSGGGLGTVTTITETVGDGIQYTPTTNITKININTTNVMPDSAGGDFQINMANQPYNSIWYLVFDNITPGFVTHTINLRIVTDGHNQGDSAGQQDAEYAMYDDAFVLDSVTTKLVEIYKFTSDDGEFDMCSFVKVTSGGKEKA